MYKKGAKECEGKKSPHSNKTRRIAMSITALTLSALLAGCGGLLGPVGEETGNTGSGLYEQILGG
jgi:hypothetical protein